MTTFRDICFDEVRRKSEENGDREIRYDAVDALILDKADFLHSLSLDDNTFQLRKPLKPRKTRKDKGIKKWDKAKIDKGMLKEFGEKEDPEGL